MMSILRIVSLSKRSSNILHRCLYSTYELISPTSPTSSEIEEFNRNGFLVRDRFLPESLSLKLQKRVEPLFRGEFSTGVYPDEWWGRPGISIPDITREICNAWKSDHTIASVVLSEQLGRFAAELCGWNGTRLAQDDIFCKGPASTAINFHQDGNYFDFLDPVELLTVWISLDNILDENQGTLEYVYGSHHWGLVPPDKSFTEAFHVPESFSYRSSLLAAAAKKEIQEKELQIKHVVVSAGGVAFHHRCMFHGSGVNKSSNQYRRALALHFIPSNSKYCRRGVGYTFGRYQARSSDWHHMNEDFFPITWTREGYRSPWLKHYVDDAMPLRNFS